MSVMGQVWLADYEGISDDYTRDCVKHGEEVAQDNARAKLRSLGFDPHEIEDEIAELVA